MDYRRLGTTVSGEIARSGHGLSSQVILEALGLGNKHGDMASRREKASPTARRVVEPSQV